MIWFTIWYAGAIIASLMFMLNMERLLDSLKDMEDPVGPGAAVFATVVMAVFWPLFLIAMFIVKIRKGKST